MKRLLILIVLLTSSAYAQTTPLADLVDAQTIGWASGPDGFSRGAGTNEIDVTAALFTFQNAATIGTTASPLTLSSPGDVICSAAALKLNASSNANAYINSGAGNLAAVLFQDNSVSKWGLYKWSDNNFVLYDSVTTSSVIEVETGGDMTLSPAGDVVMSPTGNVGIGVSDPDAQLEIDTAEAGTSLKLSDGVNSTMFISHPASNAVTFGLGGGLQAFDFQDDEPGSGSSLMWIDADGGVGIEETSPDALLHVGDNASASITGALNFSHANVDGLIVAPNIAYGTLAVQGNVWASLQMIDAGAAEDDKLIVMLTEDGTTTFASVEDDNAGYVHDNILVMDHGTGNVGIGTDSPGAAVQVSSDTGAPSDLGDFAEYQLVLVGGTDTGDTSGILLSTGIDAAGGSAIVHYDTDSNGKGDLAFLTKQSTVAEPPVESMRLDDAGNVLVGHNAVLEIAGGSSPFQVHHDSIAAMSVTQYSNNASGTYFMAGKSRSATVGTYGSIVQDNDKVLSIIGSGDDGTDLDNRAARIDFEVDGTPGANDMPGAIVFSTNAGASVTTEAMRIDSSQIATFAKDQIRVTNSKTPSAANDTGTVGTICWDANYIYICTATDTWKRVAISTW